MAKIPEHAKLPDIPIRKKYGNQPVHDIIGGKEYTFRSKAEHKLARYLQVLKEGKKIKDWEFESHNFVFDAALSGWLVDFTIRNNDDTFEYYEYKGCVEPDTRWKLYMIDKYYPKAQITMVFANKKQLRRLGSKAISCCKRVCLLGELTRGII